MARILRLASLSALVWALLPSLEPRAGQSDPLDALVEVRVLTRERDTLYPWRLERAKQGWGSGSIMEGQRILTAAHVVQDHVSVQVRRHGTSRWVDAHVAQVCDQADLALLTVDEPAFFRHVRPLALGPMPKMRDAVQVLGFPLGGRGAAVTRGVVSRINLHRYVHSRSHLLMMQIDAPVNGGASGGAVIDAGKLVGVALQSLDASRAESVGYVAPVLVIEHFLRDVEDGRVDGFPESGIWWQDLSAPAQRRALGLPEDGPGVLVRHVDDGSAAAGIVQRGDIVLAVGGTPVEDDGNIDVPEIGRVSFEFVFHRREVGDRISLEVLRDGKRQQLNLEASRYDPLIPQRFHGDRKPYLIFGGLVFQPLTYDYFQAFNKNRLPANLQAETLSPFRSADRRQVVVLTTLLHSQASSEYSWAEDLIVHSVNGVLVRDLRHFARLLDTAPGRYVHIGLERRHDLLFDIAEARGELETLLGEHDAAVDRGGFEEPGEIPASPER